MGHNSDLTGVMKVGLAAVLLGASALHGWSQQPGDTPPAAQPASSSAPASTPQPNVGIAGAQNALTGSATPLAPATVPANAPDPSLTVPAGTKVLLSVESAVNTKTAKSGDGIYLKSTFPVIVGSHVLIPAGVYVQGIVDQVQRPGRVKGRAKLLMHFTTMIFPNGQVVAIPGGVNNLPGSNGPTVKNAEGEIEQAGNKGKDAENVGKGAVMGAGGGAIGGAVSGSPLAGAGYGAAAGAAGGLIYTLFTRGDDIMIAQGSTVEMVLQRPLALEPAQLAGINDTHGMPQYTPSSLQQRPLPKPERIGCAEGAAGCN